MEMNTFYSLTKSVFKVMVHSFVQPFERTHAITRHKEENQERLIQDLDPLSISGPLTLQKVRTGHKRWLIRQLIMQENPCFCRPSKSKS
ncbi:hypothetical protein CHS0354_021467 [Potamilus streckersoni]|uniref:Uncharacterized protein n=1 Tax=Potamilus streckersoni TaxID=2493646 RepID=A0AAE0S1Y9_9BIVA|nr:hypothetical protein CHS0354_021467 [Potamilus streckersoni]